jgi:23S rRNA pseudouridine2605 synthase
LSTIRLNKLLATRGVGARRKCDALIESGAVRVNGEVVTAPGTRVVEGRDRIQVNGRPLPERAAFRYFMLNKPVGVITTLDDPEGRRTIREFLPPGGRFFPVGRLDADTSGLLVVTNDGDLAHHLMHPRYGLTKFYRVLLEREPDDGQIARLTRGVEFEPGIWSAPARVRRRDPVARGAVIEIALHEGRHRQVRRMCEAVGLRVIGLHRWAYGPLRLGELARGMYRELSEDEVARLRSSSARPRPREGRGPQPEKGRRFEKRERRPRASTPGLDQPAREEASRRFDRPRPERGEAPRRFDRPRPDRSPAPRRFDRPKPARGETPRRFDRPRPERSSAPRRFDRPAGARDSRRPERPERAARPFRGPRSERPPFAGRERASRPFARPQRGPRSFARPERGPRPFARPEREPRPARREREPRPFRGAEGGRGRSRRTEAGPRPFRRAESGARPFTRPAREGGRREFPRRDQAAPRFREGREESGRRSRFAGPARGRASGGRESRRFGPTPNPRRAQRATLPGDRSRNLRRAPRPARFAGASPRPRRSARPGKRGPRTR